jgi:ornithine cyclodeaminase/alanine dehydrogenase-like protein (mu-crystallin family)
MLYDAETAKPLALFEANWLGQIRTGAATGLATDLLARTDARVLALIGTGFQARSQMDAVLAVRAIEEVRVWSRKTENRASFVREYDGHGTRVVEAECAESAVRAADIVVTMTNARDPVLDAGWVRPGTHVNAAGSNIASRRELPGDLVESASLIVADSVEQARIEAGDLLLALGTGDWGDRVVELRTLPGRRHKDDITIFKSVGLGLEDVAVAGPVYETAVREGLGTQLLV